MPSSQTPKHTRPLPPMAHFVGWLCRRYWWLLPVGGITLLALTWLTAEIVTVRPGQTVFCLAAAGLGSSPIRLWGILLGILCGFVLFGHLWSRRESGMYLMLGISRLRQFAGRCLFGVGVITLSVALPLTLSYLRGVARIGGDASGACGVYTLSFAVALLLVSLLSYAVAVLVAVMNGRFVSAVLSIGGVLGAPYAVLFAGQGLIGKFLLGSPLGCRFDVYEGIPNLMTAGQGAGLLTMLTPYLQILTIHPNMAGVNTAGDYDKQMEAIRKAYALPAGRTALLFCVFLLLVVAAAWLYRCRGAERSGQVYAHPVMTAVVGFSFALAMGGSLLQQALPVDGMANLVLSGLIFAVVLLVLSHAGVLLLARERRALLRMMPVVGGAALVSVAVMLALGGGWFGYADYIPAPEDIASVSVSYNQNAYPLENDTYTTFSGYGGPKKPRGSTYIVAENEVNYLYDRGLQVDELTLPLTSAEDIARVRAIHETVIADGHHPYSGRGTDRPGDTAVTARYLIVYTLHDGSTVARYYNTLRLDTLEATLQIEETEVYKEAMRRAHADVASSTINLEMGDAYFLTARPLDLSHSEKAALYAALDADYADLSHEMRYHPAPEDILGIIRERTASGGTVGKPVGSGVVTGIGGNFADERGAEVFVITTAHERTLAFLGERGLIDYFAVDPKEAGWQVRAVVRQPYTARAHDMGGGLMHAVTYLFLSFPDYDQLDRGSADTVSVVPRSEWDSLIAASVPVAYLSRPCDLIRVTYVAPTGEIMVVTRVVSSES